MPIRRKLIAKLLYKYASNNPGFPLKKDEHMSVIAGANEYADTLNDMVNMPGAQSILATMNYEVQSPSDYQDDTSSVSSPMFTPRVRLS
jgi:hypothetical protein